MQEQFTQQDKVVFKAASLLQRCLNLLYYRDVRKFWVAQGPHTCMVYVHFLWFDFWAARFWCAHEIHLLVTP